VQRNSEECACTRVAKLIFPCSGAADVGEIADRAPRKLTWMTKDDWSYPGRSK
jgi:uncharacterized metal-binding protein